VRARERERERKRSERGERETISMNLYKKFVPFEIEWAKNCDTKIFSIRFLWLGSQWELQHSA
jgi:hypothetical protein